MNIFWWFYLRTMFFFMRIYRYFFNNKREDRPPTILDETTKYIENQKSRFLKKLETPNNTNIDPLFYSKSEFQEMLVDVSNPLEFIWRTRILFENTPRGNIIMHFDAFKLGFTYYSDSNIPYSVLNAVAMKYVTIYNCHDFFLDNEVTCKDSPIFKTHFDDNTKKDSVNFEENKNNDSQKNQKFLENAPFAKLKNYSKINSKINKSKNEKIVEGKEKTPEKEYHRNRFICLGKICNFQFLQKKKKIFKSNNFKTALFDGVKTECELQKRVMNYSDYKNSLKAKNNAGSGESVL